MHQINRILGALVLVLWAGSACTPSTTPSSPTTSQTVNLTVSAAANVKQALSEIATVYQQQTPSLTITLNTGSSGQLTQQIEQGAPVDLFLSANEAFVDRLIQNGNAVAETRGIYAVGRLVLWSKDRTVTLDQLTTSDIRTIAMANPDTAPYGLATRETLQTLQLWDSLQPKLIIGENIEQTLTLAQTGNVDVAFVALSLAMPSAGYWTLIPATNHLPIQQALAVMTNAPYPQEARAFAAFILGEQAQAIFKRYGYESLMVAGTPSQ